MPEHQKSSDIEKEKQTVDLDIDVLIRCGSCGNTKTIRNYQISSYDRLICSVCNCKSPEIILPIRLEFRGQVGPARFDDGHRGRNQVYIEKADLVLKCLNCSAKPESLQGFPLWLYDELACRHCGASGRQLRLASLKKDGRSFQIRTFLKSSLDAIIENWRHPKIEYWGVYNLDGDFIPEKRAFNFMEIKSNGSREERDLLLERFSNPGKLDESEIAHMHLWQKLIAWKEGSFRLLCLADLTSQVEISMYLTLSSREYRCKICQSQAFSVGGNWEELGRVLGLAASLAMAGAMFVWNENLICPSCFEEHDQDFLKQINIVDEYREAYQYDQDYVGDKDEGYTLQEHYREIESYGRSDEEGWFYED